MPGLSLKEIFVFHLHLNLYMLPHVIKLGKDLELLDRHKKLSLMEEERVYQDKALSRIEKFN